MRCMRIVDDRKMNVALIGKLLEEVESFKYLGSYVAVDGYKKCGTAWTTSTGVPMHWLRYMEGD